MFKRSFISKLNFRSFAMKIVKQMRKLPLAFLYESFRLTSDKRMNCISDIFKNRVKLWRLFHHAVKVRNISMFAYWSYFILNIKDRTKRIWKFFSNSSYILLCISNYQMSNFKEIQWLIIWIKKIHYWKQQNIWNFKLKNSNSSNV